MADIKKYDLILDALQQLMVDKSIQNISVSDIAARAGIGKGSIYYYFPSKEAILDALIRPLRGWQCCFRPAAAPPQLF